MAQTIVSQGPAFQSRPTFKLFHNDFASSGIWTVGSKDYFLLYDQLPINWY
jgi:phenylacetate 2-hydroxylase